jgi:hypothetical protein
MPKQNKNYGVLEVASGEEESTPWYACDRKRCLNGRCGVCWLVILGLGIAVGVSCIFIFADVLGFSFSTDGNDTLYELICDDCTFEPTSDPTVTPTADPTSAPTLSPTEQPTDDPSKAPTVEPTSSPTEVPSVEPSGVPSVEPTYSPTDDPTVEPSGVPSVEPTLTPTSDPTVEPSVNPTAPTSEPTSAPTGEPTLNPTLNPTVPTSEPTYDPTSPTAEPTSDPTAERRMDDKSDLTSNVLMLIANGTEYLEFNTPEVEKFLKEGYTFRNLTKKHSLNSLISGRTVVQKAFSWVQQLRSRGYINHYYGKWLFGKSAKAWNFDGRGWQNYRVINNHQDQILDEVQTAINMLSEERWSITVGLTKSDAYTGFHHNSKNFTIHEICSRYFKDGGHEFNHDLGVSCVRSIRSDEKIGEVLHTLRSTGVWEQTIVMLIIIGDQKNMLSIGGGALPANFFRTVNKDLTSFLDVVPTILSVAGFTESQLQLVKLKGLPLISFNKSPSGSL